MEEKMPVIILFIVIFFIYGITSKTKSKLANSIIKIIVYGFVAIIVLVWIGILFMGRPF